LDARAVMVLRSWSFSIGRVGPNPFEFLQSDSFQAIPLPVTQVADSYFATRNEPGIGAHVIGIFPQSVGNIPHPQSLSVSLEPLHAALTMLAHMLHRAAA